MELWRQEVALLTSDYEREAATSFSIQGSRPFRRQHASEDDFAVVATQKLRGKGQKVVTVDTKCKQLVVTVTKQLTFRVSKVRSCAGAFDDLVLRHVLSAVR